MCTGIGGTSIPYKGGAQAIADVMGGSAQVLFNGMLATYPAGAKTRPDSPAGFGNFIRDEKARRAKVLKDSGVKFD